MHLSQRKYLKTMECSCFEVQVGGDSELTRSILSVYDGILTLSLFKIALDAHREAQLGVEEHGKPVQKRKMSEVPQLGFCCLDSIHV